MTKIKICGLTRAEDIAAVNRCRPDYIGFVFAKSRRQVTAEQARRLKAGLDGRIGAVGVFVNESLENIVALCEAGTIDMVQLHGDESEDYIQVLKKAISCLVVKSVRVQNPGQILEAQEMSCDLLLLDTYQENQYGGSGRTFNLELIPKLYKPFLLAGGLNLANIAEAVNRCHPYGVDVSSGVETNGFKDENKICELITAVRNLG